MGGRRALGPTTDALENFSAMFDRHGGRTGHDWKSKASTAALRRPTKPPFSSQLPHLAVDEARQKLARDYVRGLAGGSAIRLPQVAEGREHVYTVRRPHVQRDGLRDHLGEPRPPAQLNYPIALRFSRLPRTRPRPRDFHVAQEHQSQGRSLSRSIKEITPAQVYYLRDEIKSVRRRLSRRSALCGSQDF